jgi:folate-binding protein YgfZ
MEGCKYAELANRGVVRVSGSDARKFLQDVVTNDVAKATDGKAVHTALLTPQGKILFDFFLLDHGDHLMIECAREATPDLIKRLTFYKLRASVELEDVSSAHTVWAVWGGSPDIDSDSIIFRDPRLEALGFRVIAPSGVEPPRECNDAGAAAYHAHRIALGVPESNRDYPLGDTFPHEADYDQLGGVDFKKGCYVGQEVVGRMQHRGNARRRIVPVKGSAALTAGSEITAGDSAIGVLGSVSGECGLAIVRLDRAEKAQEDGRPIMAGDVEIELLQPDWAKFTVPTKDAAR